MPTKKTPQKKTPVKKERTPKATTATATTGTKKKGRGRPQLSAEEKKRRALERCKAKLEGQGTQKEREEKTLKIIEDHIPDPNNPPGPNISTSKKNGGDRGSEKGVKNAETNRAIIRHVYHGMKHSLVDTYSGDAIIERFMEYLNSCDEDGIIPTMEGVYLWLGMDKGYFSKIITRNESYIRPEETIHALEKIKSAMAAAVSSAADAGTIAPATAIMKLTNSFGYTDVKQVQHVATDTVRIGTEDSYKQLQEKYNLNQIMPDVIDTDFVELDENGNPIEK